MSQVPALYQSSPVEEERRPLVDTGSLAARLHDELSEAMKSRKMVEERWLEDLSQYRGQYSADVLDRLKRYRRSQVYYRLTTQKVNTLTARLMDLLFPQKSKNWGIEPTPDPEIPDDVIMQEMQGEIEAGVREAMGRKLGELQAQNIMPDAWAVQNLQAQSLQEVYARLDTRSARVRIARERASAMEQVIDDQLKECNANGQRRPSWQQNCRSVVKDACLYGMGVLKGPLIEKVDTRRYRPMRDIYGNVSWQEEVVASSLRPYHEAVSVWDVFPDPGARLPGELRFVWQIHLMADKDLRELARFPGFNAETIRGYMREFAEGDAQLEEWEVQTREINADNLSVGAELKNRFRVYERWGFLTGAELRGSGADLSEEDDDKVFSSNVWMLGDHVIKAMVNPLEGIDIPYYFYPFQQDDTSFWPEGLGSLLRHPQAGMNAAVRAMQDNAAASSGPMIGVNMAALAPGEDPTAIQANRTVLFDKPGLNISDAFQVATIPSCIEHNLTLSNFWSNAGDEISTPRFQAGDGNVSGAGKTASGLSMLMGAANILLKDHIKDFDDCVVTPFIRAMFRWNMQWNEDESIKGDYEVVASGSQSLIAKEVRAQQIPMLISWLSIPGFADRIKEEKLLEVALEQTDLPVERILRSDEEAQQYRQARAFMQAQAQVQALAAQLEQQGMTPEEINRQMLLLMAQLSAQAGGGMQALPAPSTGGTEVGR